MTRRISATALGAAIAACAMGGGGRFEFQLQGDDFVQPLTVVVVDRTGFVRSAAEFLGDAPEGVSTAPGEPNALVVSWLGGACDSLATLIVESSANSWTITEKTDRESDCLLIGITRSVVVRLSAPVSPDIVQLVTD